MAKFVLLLFLVQVYSLLCIQSLEEITRADDVPFRDFYLTVSFEYFFGDFLVISGKAFFLNYGNKSSRFLGYP